MNSNFIIFTLILVIFYLYFYKNNFKIKKKTIKYNASTMHPACL